MFNIIETTTNDRSVADLISNTLLKKQLSPCIQVIKSVDSLYIWNGKATSESEIIIRIKANNVHCDEIANIVKSLHNYDNPELITYKFNILSKEYKNWFTENSS